MESEGDDRLAERLAERDPEAWEELLSRFGGKLEAVCRRTLAQAGARRDPGSVADAVAEVVRALLDRDARILRRFRPGSSLGAYLAVVARGVTIDALRKRDPAGIPWLEEPAADPGGEAELAEQVRKSLSELPSRDAEILGLFHLEGLSYREISGRTGIPEGQVGVYLLRARSALKERLGPGIRDFL